MPFQHGMPIDRRQHLFLEEPGQGRRLGTIEKRKGWQQLAAITEFGQNDLAALHRQRAGTIAIVNRPRRLARKHFERIDGHHRRLLAHGGRGFGIRRRSRIAKRKDIAEFRVLQGFRIDIHPTGLIRQRAFADEIGRALRRTDMDHVEAALDRLGAAVLLRDREPCLPGRTVDRLQILIEAQVDAIAIDIAHQRRHIIGHAEQHPACIVEGHFDIVQASAAPPVIAGQIHGLLRRTGTFDRHRRLGEQGHALAQVLHQFPGVRGKVEQVIGSDAVLAQRLLQSFDSLPVQLQPRRDHQHPIADAFTILQDHFIGFRRKAGGSGANPPHPVGNDGGHRLFRLGAVENPAADQGPARLIIMLVAGFDDDDVKAGLAPQHAGGHRDAARAAADDHHLMALARRRAFARSFLFCRRRIGRCGSGAGFDLRAQGGKVISGFGRRLQNGIRIQSRRHRQRPQGTGSRSRAAEGQNRPSHAVKRLGKCLHILVRDLAGNNGDMDIFQTIGLCRGLQFIGRGLTVFLPIGAIVDDDLEALGCGNADILHLQLRRNGYERRNLAYLHRVNSLSSANRSFSRFCGTGHY